MRRQAIVERLIKKTQDGTLEQTTVEPMDKKLEDEMGVRIGDEIHYHNEQPRETTRKESEPSKAASVAKTIAAVGLATAGIGAGVALPVAAYNLTRPTTNGVTVIEDPTTDTNTKYGLRIYRDQQR